MESFDDLLRQAELAHGHLCAGQILGVRLAMLGCQRLGIPEPRTTDRKRLVTFVEIDRCATDAIAVVTGCRLGKRALKVRDWGKMAATFVDLASPIPALASPIPALGAALEPVGETPVYKGIRIAALESSKQRARELYPGIDLFSEQWVRVPLHPREMPGYKSQRIACAVCGEGINYDRNITDSTGRILCQSCAAPENRYYEPLT